MRITVAAPAKVNLWLRVGPPGESGYHDLDTLFCTLHLADIVTLRPGVGPEPTLDASFARPLTRAPDLGPHSANLVVRSARGFMDRAGLDEGPVVRLVKRIPAGAGLGGGSSDAAAVLLGMSRLYPGRVSPGGLREEATALGSDVLFFLEGGPLALGTGRGARLTPLAPLPERSVVVALPGFGVSTAAAYGWLDEDRDAGRIPERTLAPRPDWEPSWDAVTATAENDFEEAVFRRHPELGEIRDTLADAGADPALMAGSGSTVFGVFREGRRAREAATALREQGLTVVGTRTRTR